MKQGHHKNRVPAEAKLKALLDRALAARVEDRFESAAQMLDVELDLAKGVVVEATLQCSSNTTAGLVVRGASGDTAFLVDCDRQHFLVGSTVWDRSPGFDSNEALHLRLLLRSTPTGVVGMSEFYVNDIMCVLHSLRRATRG